MLKPEQLKVGLLVWWRRNGSHYGSSWSCPCVVTTVIPEENAFQVRSLDDFKETSRLAIERGPESDPSSLTEMRICSTEEVKDYLHGKMSSHLSAISADEQSLEARKRSAQRYAEQANALIATFK